MIANVACGTNTMMIDGVTVESSDNLALIKEEDGFIKSEISLRSSENHVLDELSDRIKKTLEDLNINYTIDSIYPGWEYKEDSKLRPLAQKVYKEFEGKEFDTIVIHAGLECISGAHSPEEKVEIESVQRVYDYLKELLKEIK